VLGGIALLVLLESRRGGAHACVVRMKRNRQHVVIIGGGVIGLCSAYYALKRGFAVTVIEREQPGGDNCSLGNAGMIVPSHFIPLAAPGMLAKGLRWILDPRSPFFVRPRIDLSLARWGWLFYRHSTAAHVEASRDLLRDLNLESRRLFAELATQDDFGLVQRGLLMLCRTEHGLDEEAAVAKEANDIGLRADVINDKEAARIDPDCTMNIVGAVHFRDDCHLDPARFVEAMRRQVVAMGGVLESGVEIERLETTGGQVTAAIRGDRRFEGSDFIVAGGSWSALLLKSVGLRLPLQPGKGYSLTLPKPPQLPRLCSIFCEDKVAITPMGDSLRFGGTMEVGGLNLRVAPKRVQGIVRSVPRYFPKFQDSDFEGIRPWAGLRPVSPDGIPYLGKVKHLPNLIINTGHAMMGLSLAPVSGRLAADLLAGDTPFRPIHALAPERF
jgi:D-amino-acid dehydrogenase